MHSITRLDDPTLTSTLPLFLLSARRASRAIVARVFEAIARRQLCARSAVGGDGHNSTPRRQLVSSTTFAAHRRGFQMIRFERKISHAGSAPSPLIGCEPAPRRPYSLTLRARDRERLHREEPGASCWGGGRLRGLYE